MKDLWKGIAILGIWGSIAACAFAGTAPAQVALLGLVAVIATAFVALGG